MNSEIEFLSQIRMNPLLYLGEKNLKTLLIFLDGYSACEYFHNPAYKSPLLWLLDYVMHKYHDYAGNLYSIIRNQTESEETAFYMFFDLVDEYLQFPSYKKNKFYFDAVNMLYDINSIIPIKNYFDCNVEAYPDYTDFPQFVNAYYKNNLKIDWAQLILANTSSDEQAKFEFKQILEMYLKKIKTENQ